MEGIPVRKEGKEKTRAQVGLGKGEFNDFQAMFLVLFFFFNSVTPDTSLSANDAVSL